MRPRSGIRSTVRRLPSHLPRRRRSEAALWRSYMKWVEPKLLAHPRAYRFAQVPLAGDSSMRPPEVAAWIEGDPAAAKFTRDALARGSASPAEILGGSLTEALSSTRCRYVALLRAGDQPAPAALERLGQAAAIAPGVTVFTCDEDQLDRRGGRSGPRLRPGPSPDRWLSLDDSGPLLLVDRAAAADTLPKLSSSAAWSHELALRLAGQSSEHHAHVPMLLCHRAAGAHDPPTLESKLVAQIAKAARVDEANGVRRVRRPLGGEPSIEVVICFRDRADLLARCVNSLIERTSYQRLSVALVDNGSTASATNELLTGLTRREGVRVLRDEGPFNFAALNNRAARSSSADVLVFLNNDTEIIDEEWLEPLLEEALRGEIGAVAPLLVYSEGAVQHAGAAIGLHGYAGHPFAGLMPDTPTPFGRAAEGTRNWLAVTAACMMIERAKFDSVGGFDESFVVAGNDVDLCLRLTAAGHRSLCVPHARVIHDEASSRGTHIDPNDFVRSERSYGEFRTVGDPFYNPSLTLKGTDCSLRQPDEADS
jgi:O-antigen biosynthesis protein